ncbi:MAG: hypothetical protein HZA91_14330, partial [Verrucomicrobia bacterium]|nr:hypothetical protein [Verrucomicrobiota bacterium]
PVDGSGRARCGKIEIERAGGRVVVRLQPEPPSADLAMQRARVNSAGKVVDFGPVATNGAFRLRYAGAGMELTPLPSSQPFRVELRLDRLGATETKAQHVSALDIEGKTLDPVAFTQDGPTLRFAADGKAFRYLIRFGGGAAAKP